MTDDQLLLFGDARIMLVSLTAVSFLVVACQTAVTQTATVLENRELYVALDRLGMLWSELHRARRLRVTIPARIAVIGAALAATLLASFLVLAAVTMAPLFVAATLIVLSAGFFLVRAGVAVTAPVLRSVLAALDRGEDERRCESSSPSP